MVWVRPREKSVNGMGQVTKKVSGMGQVMRKVIGWYRSGPEKGQSVVWVRSRERSVSGRVRSLERSVRRMS